MSPALARPLVHAVHVVTFLVLLVTGVLLLFPGLRAAVTGGYSLILREIHRWGGVLYLILPTWIIVQGGARRVLAPAGERTARATWQGLHVAVTILVGDVFTLTGFAIWDKGLLPEALVDGSVVVHDWLTYAAITLLTLHVFDVGVVALLARIQAARVAVGEPSEP